MKERGHSWKDMKLHIETFVKRCPICQKNSDSKNKSKLKPFTLASVKPMQRIAVDTIVNVDVIRTGINISLLLSILSADTLNCTNAKTSWRRQRSKHWLIGYVVSELQPKLCLTMDPNTSQI